MAQEFSNTLDLLGAPKERQAFLADALKLSPQWGWDWAEIIVNDQARSGGESGKSRIHFYTRNFPHGLDPPHVDVDGSPFWPRREK